MKKALILLFVATLFTGLTSSVKKPAAEGIVFESLTYEEALKKAKKTGKLVFIDVYTVWCGPCKKMARDSFTQPEVAKLYNKNFINIKIEAEKDADGPVISRKYKVSGYPTLLFLDEDGVVKKSLLGYQTGDQLLSHGESMK